MRNPVFSRDLTLSGGGFPIACPRLCWNLHFAQVALARESLGKLQVFLDGISDIREGLFFPLALRPASRQTRARNAN